MEIESITLEDIYDGERTKNICEKGKDIVFALHIAGKHYKTNREIMYLSHDTVMKIIEDSKKLSDLIKKMIIEED